MISLRSYQEIMLAGMHEEFDIGRKRVCLVAPCGAGKTVLMAWIALQASLKRLRVLFAVHRQELIAQSSQTLANAGIHHGVIAPRQKTGPEHIQVGMVMSIAKRLERLEEPDVIIFDEAHHAAANTWKKIIEAYPKAYIIGLTATPERMSGQGLGDIFQSLVVGPNVKQLIEWGNLAPFRYYAPPIRADFSKLRVKYGEYVKDDVETEMNRSEIIGNAIEHYRKLADGKKAICYCAGRAHSEHTAAMFTKNGIPALHIDGETPDIERKKAITAFRSGEIKVLCNVDLISEGFDVPSMEAVILLRPTKSLTLHVQQSMRPMRPDENNPEKVAVIIDHVGNVYRHGLPDEERFWTLATREKQEREILLRQCPQCYAAHKPARICPFCGYEYEIESRSSGAVQRKGELVAIEELERKERRREVGRAKNICDLEEIAIKRGYKLGWIHKMAKIKNIKG